MKFSFFTSLRRYRWIVVGRHRIRNRVKKMAAKGTLKVVLGAGPTEYDGWISTDLPHFDILKASDWAYFFRSDKADNLLIEHVLEHFTKEEVPQALSLAHHYLKPGGCIRIAVPDGYHPDKTYINFVAPPSDGHQSLWNIDSLNQLLTEKGFKTEALEYYTREGTFSEKDCNDANGSITRSRKKHYNGSVPNYSSLIVDAYKN